MKAMDYSAKVVPSRIHMVAAAVVVLTTIELFHVCHGDVGIAATYAPPYTPTACYGSDPSQFPPSNLFAVAGEGIWDNGAACGRQYLVKCINTASPQSCIPNTIIQVKIIDRAQTSTSRPSKDGAIMVLSTTALNSIANGSPRSLNIEFQQV